MKEYDVEWLEVKTLKKGNLELGHIKKGRYLSPPDLAGVEFSQYIPKDNIYGIYAESAKQAECYFSQFCQQKRIKCMRVPKGTEKTPDFVFYPSGQKVAVEVKWRGDDGGITKENGLIDRAPYGIGRWVYDQIRESSKQFKTFWEQGIPTMLLLVDGSSESRLEEYEIERGMYGHEVVKLKVHSDWTEYVGIRNEYEYRMANGNRQRVSAVAYLQSYGKVSGNDPNIVYHPEVYHRLYVCYNPFADYPLSQEWLKDIDFSIVDLIEDQNER